MINLPYEKHSYRNGNEVLTDLCVDNYRDRYLRNRLNSIQHPIVIHRLCSVVSSTTFASATAKNFR